LARRIAPRDERQRLVEILATQRKKLGLSQRTLSTKLGWHPMTMHRIEAGQRGLEIVELVELCAALELNVMDALREAGLK
jgi:ribosome-binding protein aMBF1 (putative translation factor)